MLVMVLQDAPVRDLVDRLETRSARRDLRRARLMRRVLVFDRLTALLGYDVVEMALLLRALRRTL